MNISFGWTTPALLVSFDPVLSARYGAKLCTRREWAPDHAAQVYAADARDGLLHAWNASARNPEKDPHEVGTIRLTCAPYESNEFPEADYELEGFPLLQRLGLKIGTGRRAMLPRDLWRWWQELRPTYTIVRFEPIALTDAGRRDLERLCL